MVLDRRLVHSGIVSLFLLGVTKASMCVWVKCAAMHNINKYCVLVHLDRTLHATDGPSESMDISKPGTQLADRIAGETALRYDQIYPPDTGNIDMNVFRVA